MSSTRNTVPESHLPSSTRHPRHVDNFDSFDFFNIVIFDFCRLLLKIQPLTRSSVWRGSCP